MNLAIAIHYLKVLSESIQNLIILLDEVDCLVVDGTVHDTLCREETSIDEKVTEGNTCHG
jgi:hypothetical protein